MSEKQITMSDVKRISKETGHHFFNEKNMAHSNSRIESELVKNKYFMTSEQTPAFSDGAQNPRKYAVHEFEAATGKTLPLSGTQAFGSKQQANEYMKSLRELTDIQKDAINTLKNADCTTDAERARIAWRTGKVFETNQAQFQTLLSDPEKQKIYNANTETLSIKPPRTKSAGMSM
jgi:hypothetical protein